MTSLRDIRQQFLNFFEEQGHTVAASSPLVPNNDPTLLFTNAGMVQFKDYFTGGQTPPYPRAVTSQKCVRAGGKHNDLDNVGYTARHHTFFEMLGNFSFGDYFKENAIEHAWNLVTKDFGLDKDKLLVTVYHTDDEAFDLWKKIAGLSDERIIRIATSDNFWAMGDTGPCGPCSEIFYDHGSDIPGGPPGSPDEDGDRFIEIWNLVFMQFERSKDGTQTPLPKPSIDTGMGLERTAAILQGKHDNYDIDLFQNLIGASVELTGVKAEGEAKFSHRVIADHLRSCSFLMADGVTPSNEGRGYVLRRIMRRAMRHAHILGAKDPLMHRLVPSLISEMGDAYAELGRAKASFEATFEQEEERFRRTLGRGTALLEEATAELGDGDTLDGETAFKLYDTYGFPLDLTQDALRAKGIEVDKDGFDAAMAQQKEDSRAAGFKSGDVGTDDIWLAAREASGPTEFTGYEDLFVTSPVQTLVVEGEVANSASDTDVMFVTPATPFYAESGGQAGDKGVVSFENGAQIVVKDVVKKAGDLHVHIGSLTGEISRGDVAYLTVNSDNRKRTMANHSATHIMHEALRRILGEHVTQKGQMVDGERIRFDISHGSAITREELAKVEDQVNQVILQNAEASTELMNPEAAMAAGAMALFGEKYGDEVRVLSLGDPIDEDPKAYSVELCGGTHVDRTGDIALFKIVSEGAVAAGIRRVEAVTGEAARQHLETQAGYTRAAADKLKAKPEDVPARIEALIADRKKLEKELSETKKALALGGSGGSAAKAEEINGVKFMGGVLEGVSGKDLRAMLNDQLSAIGSGIVGFVAKDGAKVAVAVAVTDDLIGKYNAATLVNAGAEKVGGRGGGKPGMAQAGGSQPENADEALAAIKASI
ncbi:alanine--tRNA ligase [Hellea balneolensis]|uniref:alanine--tRNA ligase n=1 Tax=Hellea balneolensis TaxID=287478 RepID=UPI000410ED7B|nr:alanine--tRNA ligase [Hellea balneolensis]